MKLFLVSVQDDYESRAQSLIETHYPDHNFRLEKRQSPQWVIATPNERTPAHISDSLNMKTSAGTERVVGMVVQITNYFGHDSMALWQQLEAWLDEE